MAACMERPAEVVVGGAGAAGPMVEQVGGNSGGAHADDIDNAAG
jgi:hypothetical protein